MPQFILVSHRDDGLAPPLAYGPFTNDEIAEYMLQGKTKGLEIIALFSAEDFPKHFKS